MATRRGVALAQGDRVTITARSVAGLLPGTVAEIVEIKRVGGSGMTRYRLRSGGSEGWACRDEFKEWDGQETLETLGFYGGGR